MCVEKAAVERGRMVKPPIRKAKGAEWREMLGDHSDKDCKQTAWKCHRENKTFLKKKMLLHTMHIEVFYVGDHCQKFSPNFSFNWEKIKCMITDVFADSLITELYSNV